mmetsp:Transcript_72062/g.182188  ORF Transcript_72062/g.182188 Transcript_72062/m.182188 type:complete len:299 (+) Transcript_72062:691-1587(+)
MDPHPLTSSNTSISWEGRCLGQAELSQIQALQREVHRRGEPLPHVLREPLQLQNQDRRHRPEVHLLEHLAVLLAFAAIHRVVLRQLLLLREPAEASDEVHRLVLFFVGVAGGLLRCRRDQELAHVLGRLLRPVGHQVLALAQPAVVVAVFVLGQQALVGLGEAVDVVGLEQRPLARCVVPQALGKLLGDRIGQLLGRGLPRRIENHGCAEEALGRVAEKDHDATAGRRALRLLRRLHRVPPVVSQVLQAVPGVKRVHQLPQRVLLGAARHQRSLWRLVVVRAQALLIGVHVQVRLQVA